MQMVSVLALNKLELKEMINAEITENPILEEIEENVPLLDDVARQEIEVNSELRVLQVTGVVRPQDIASDNTVTHDRMAEARITYGGRGQLTDVQSPRWGQQVMDIVLPF